MHRTEGEGKVTGSLAYTEDLRLAGLAHAKLVTSFVASGVVKAIDTERAARLPGVVAVLTADDLGLDGDGPDEPLARGRVFHVGQPVAVVVAETAAQAADAAAEVEVEYEPQPAAVGLERALSENAPRVLPETLAASDEASLHGAGGGGDDEERDAGAHGASLGEQDEDHRASGNVTSHVRLRRGDVDQALREAAHVVGGTYSAARVHQGFLEPHVVTADCGRDGRVTVWSPTQGHGEVRRAVASSLRAPAHQVHVVPMPVGGGFGGKIVLLEPLMAHVARAVRRPVRLALTRNEEFLVGRPAPAARVELQLGATADGDLTALRAQVTIDNGSGGGWHAGIVSEFLVSTYRVPNFAVDGAEVATNKLPGSAYRAPGAPQAYFALESVMDELARALSMDPIELRLRNASREGDPRGDGSPWPRIGLVECLEAARRHPAYTEPRVDGEGLGVAAGCWIGGFGPAAAACRLEPDGSLQLQLGSVDISGSDSGFAELAADVFGIAPERIRVAKGDSDTAPEAPLAAGSATTYSVGPAVIRAVTEVRREVMDIAATKLEAAVEDLELQDGEVRVKGAPFRKLTLVEIAALAASGSTGRGPVHAMGRAAVNAAAPMFAVHVARARVDDGTGELQVTRYGAIHDIGHPLNPREVEAQIHGGIAQGLGRALGEEIAYDEEGQLRNGSFADYFLPAVDTVPSIEVELVHVPSEQGPRGARGIGEPPVVPVLAAVANAVRDGTGRRLTSAPFDLESIAAPDGAATVSATR
jgi:CO/xanthine dehydrogenase Mo-binding subunit